MVPQAVVNDLLRTLEVGEEACQTFKWTRLDDDSPSVKFHDKMKKQILKTFSTKTSRMKGQNVVLNVDRDLFSQMILVAESRSVNMKDVLSGPGPPTGPTAMSTGKCRWVPTKNKQAALAMELAKNVSPA